jgi:polyphenol oxidase
MYKSHLGKIPIYKFQLFDKIGNIDHFITTRAEHQNDPIGGFNLSYKVNDTEENVLENRTELSLALELKPNELFIPIQTHSAKAIIVNSKDDHNKLNNTDALITTRKNMAIAIMTADCVPILLYDYKNGIAATIHAGWKGTVGKIVENTIEQMVHKLGAETKNMIAGIGPSICDKVYEVGNEVAEEFEILSEKERNLVVLRHPNPEKKYLNLQMANKLQLLNVGLKPENIEEANICTFTNNNEFYSARYFKNNCGRFATGIVIR